MIINILLLIFGFLLLIKGADMFVDGASSMAHNFKVPKMLIGLTIVAFGTSAPEFAVSIQSLAHHRTDMLLGNVIGSNILNILLILGIAALIHPIRVNENTVQKEIPFCMLVSTILSVLFLDFKLGNGIVNQISREDAIIILLFFSIFLYYLIALAKMNKTMNTNIPSLKLGTSILFTIIGIIGIIIGSDLVVNNASSMAALFGISERIIALSVIALGTSLPELVTTIVSSKKKEQELLLGNIIGSNIFNICVVLGIPVAIYGTITPSSFSEIDLIMLIGSSILLFVFATTHKTIQRWEGIIMIITFILYYIFTFGVIK